MREILFRAKRDEAYCPSQYWTYGVPFIDHEGDCIFKTSASEFVVDPETVGQYTGLTDKNGKKIFEGDIVRMHYGNEYTEVGFIRYSTDCCRFHFVDTLTVGYGFDATDVLEVIGNIHDNPVLLRGE